MKSKFVSKELICEAIMTEPLSRGKWIHAYSGDIDSVASQIDCIVCVVGAVLRHTDFFTLWDISCFGSSLRIYAKKHSVRIGYFASQHDVNWLLSKKQWMAALSAKFESQGEFECVTLNDRRALVRWVRKNFPSKVLIKIK